MIDNLKEYTEEILSLIGILLMGIIIAVLLNDVTKFGKEGLILKDSLGLIISNGIVLAYWALISISKLIQNDFSLKVIFKVPSFILLTMLSIIGIFIGFNLEILKIDKPILLAFIATTIIILFLFSIRDYITEEYIPIINFLAAFLIPLLLLTGIPLAILAIVGIFYIPAISLPALVPLIHAIIFIIIIIKGIRATRNYQISAIGFGISTVSIAFLFFAFYTKTINPETIFHLLN